jgi:excisionase family DNA binding protein
MSIGGKWMNEELITVEEAARILKVRRETIRRYIKNGHLHALTLPGGDYRLRDSDIQELLSRNTDKVGSRNGE